MTAWTFNLDSCAGQVGCSSALKVYEMKIHVTATLLAKMKRQAKQRAKHDETAYSLHLEAVAHEHGFSSWFDVLQLRSHPAPTAESLDELEIDPILREAFDDTPNEDRSEEELQRKRAVIPC